MNQYVFEEERPVVDTKCGKIRGIAYGGVNIFMGIDYAKAKMESLFTVKAKNTQINKELKNTTDLIIAQRKAASKYQGYVDKLAKNATKGKKGLKQSEVNKYIKLIKNGSLTKDAIKSIKNEKLKTFVENYQTYHDKAVDAKKAVQENIAFV